MVEGIDSANAYHLDIPSKVKGKPVTVIAKYGFQHWDIKSVSIPDTITMIGDYAFYQCTSLTEVEIPSSVTTIGSGAFQCGNLSKVTLHDGLKTVGWGAFYGAGQLEELIIPDTVEVIKDYGFYTYFSCIYVPKGVREMGESVFIGKIGTNYPISIYCESAGKPEGWNTAFVTDNYGKADYSSVVWGYTK